MDSNSADLRFMKAVIIVNNGTGSKVMRIASQNGIKGGIVQLGKGTVKSRLLSFLELNDIRKEIVTIAGEESTLGSAMAAIDKELELHKPYHGIAYTMPLTILDLGQYDHIIHKNGENTIMYNAINIIVDKGKAEQVMDLATAAGARGGTILKARGAGVYQTGKLFHMDIEPEKEMVLILAKTDIVENIVTAIHNGLNIEEKSSGIIFCQDVNSVYGVAGG